MNSPDATPEDYEWTEPGFTVRPAQKDAPDAVAAARGEYTSTPSREQMMNTPSIPESTDVREPLRPIYGKNDPRWGELAEWMATNIELDDDGSPCAEMEGTFALTPTEKAAWYEIHVHGAEALEVSRREVLYPAVPADLDGPVWFDGDHPDVGGVQSMTEYPTIGWDRMLVDDSTTQVRLWREDLYLPELDEIAQGAEKLRVYVDGEPMPLPDDLATPDGLMSVLEVLTAGVRAAIDATRTPAPVEAREVVAPADVEPLVACSMFEWCQGHNLMQSEADGVHMTRLTVGVYDGGEPRIVWAIRYEPTNEYDEPARWSFSMPTGDEWSIAAADVDAEIAEGVDELLRARTEIKAFLARWDAQ